MSKRKKDYLIEINKLIDQEKYKDIETLVFKIIRNYEDSLLYYYLGLAQIMLNKEELGVDNLWRSISLDIDLNLKYPRNLLANIYIKRNDYSLAEKFLKESIQIDKYLSTYLTLIDVLIILEKKNEANNFLEIVKIEFSDNIDLESLISLEKEISSIGN